MPVKVSRVEEGIYRYEWLGVTTVDETIEALHEAVALGQQHGDNPHIQIIDLGGVTRYPVDLRLGRIGEMQKAHVIRVMVVAAPSGAGVLGRTLARIIPALSNMEFHKTLESAVDAGRRLVIEDRQLKRDKP